jgi:hypothetical protein
MQEKGFEDDEIREAAKAKNKQWKRKGDALEHRELEQVITQALKYPKGERKTPEERQKELANKLLDEWYWPRLDQLLNSAVGAALYEQLHPAKGILSGLALRDGRVMSIGDFVDAFVPIPVKEMVSLRKEAELRFPQAERHFLPTEEEKGEEEDDELDLSMFGVVGGAK